MSFSGRDRQLRQALDFALAHTTDETAIGAIFGALASMVETSDDAEALDLAQKWILVLLGGFPPGSAFRGWVLQHSNPVKLRITRLHVGLTRVHAGDGAVDVEYLVTGSIDTEGSTEGGSDGG